MPKKTKRPKAPKQSKGGSVDNITGAKWDLDGFAIESDRIYINNNSLKNSFGTADANDPATNGWTQEFELGSKGYIIHTISSTRTGELGISDTITERYAWEGDFTFSNGSLSKAKIRRLYSERHSTANNTSQTTSITQKLGYVVSLNEYNGVSLRDPRLSSSWLESLQSSDIRYTRILDFEVQSTGIPSYGNEAEFRGYESNPRFFPDGWWNNPFSPNLL
jgi:hypothetical protein